MDRQPSTPKRSRIEIVTNDYEHNQSESAEQKPESKSTDPSRSNSQPMEGLAAVEEPGGRVDRNGETVLLSHNTTNSDNSITCSLNHDVCPGYKPLDSNLTRTNVVTVLDMMKQVLLSQGSIQVMESLGVVSTYQHNFDAMTGERLNYPPLESVSVTTEVLKDVLAFMESVSVKEVEAINPSKQKVNPICNDLILSHVMKYLCVDDLSNCRLVSKFWNRMATPLFKKSHWSIDFYSDTHIQDFCRDLENTMRFPFRFFKFRPFNIRKKNIHSFFENFGVFVEHIVHKGDLDRHPDTEIDHFVDVVICGLRNTPNIETVELVDIPGGVATRRFVITDEREPPFQLPKVKTLRVLTHLVDEFHPEFFSDVFKLMPNITKLGIGIPVYRAELQPSFLPMNRKLTSLTMGYEDYSTFMSPTMLEHLTLNQFSFETLTFNFNFNTGTEAVALEKFFTLQKDCLKVLNVESTMNNATKICFPRMTKLESMSISYMADNPSDLEDEFVPKILFNPFTPNVFPALRDIDVDIWCAARLFPFRSGSFPTVGRIRMEYTDCDVINKSEFLYYFTDIRSIFPKLKAFEIVFADSDVVREIFTNMQYIEELELEYDDDFPNHSSVDINNVLCGFPSSCEWISSQLITWKKNHSHDNFKCTLELFTNPPYLSLLDMKRLTKLRIVGPEDGVTKSSEIITDVSVYLVLLKMQRLHQLVLRQNNCLSDEAISDLTDRHTNTKIE